jgi:putative ABC transport system permease protein
MPRRTALTIAVIGTLVAAVLAGLAVTAKTLRRQAA